MSCRERLQLLFGVTGLLGAVTIFFATVFVPVLPAFTVDAVLTPEEVKNPQLREIAQRTADYGMRLQPSAIYVVLGGLVVATSALGVLAAHHRQAADQPDLDT